MIDGLYRTDMARETAEAPSAVAAMLRENRPIFEEIVRVLRKRNPPFIVTGARGSSDHAATYLKYLAEIGLGLPCCSIGASVVSIYGAKLRLGNSVLVSISQSGQSPDILALQAEARRAGALTVALTNQETSQLAREADICVPLRAGPEKSPAATKTFITSVSACARLVAGWLDDRTMAAAVENLPDTLNRAHALDWSPALSILTRISSLYVVGRGPSAAIAQEAALKLKETSGLHAEAFSAAEMMHGPLELAGKGFPVFAFCPADDAQALTLKSIERVKAAGAEVIAASDTVIGDVSLGYAKTGHPLLDPISLIQSFYRLAEALAGKLGRDPDRPRLLRKETATL